MEDEAERTSPPGNYAFLNHSPTTVPNNLPPNVDDKPLARQKRRRTRYINTQIAIESTLTFQNKP